MLALIFVLVAVHSVKNTAIDLAAVLRGQTPPSHTRQMARIAAGTARRPARSHGTMSGFFADAYGDAWEAANDWRQRKAKVAARNRRARWAAEDEEFAKRVPAPVNPTVPPAPTEVPKPKKVDPNTVPAPNQDAQAKPVKTGGDGSVPESVAPVFGRISKAFGKINTDGPLPGADEIFRKQLHDEKVDRQNREASLDGMFPGRNRGTDWTASPDDPRSPIYRGQRDSHESEYQRYAMRIRNGGKPMTSDQVQKDLGISPQEADEVLARWDGRYTTENVSKDELKATYGRECAEAMKLHDAGRHDEAQAHIDRAADVARKMGITSEEELFSLFQETQTESPKSATPSQPKEVQSKSQSENAAGPASSPTVETQKEVPAVTATTTAQNSGAGNAETIGLRAGLTFLKGMKEQCELGASNTEISTTSLAAGEVGAGVTGPMAQAQDMLLAVAHMFDEAYKELERSIAVKEAYEANPSAGNKQFLTQD